MFRLVSKIFDQNFLLATRFNIVAEIKVSALQSQNFFHYFIEFWTSEFNDEDWRNSSVSLSSWNISKKILKNLFVTSMNDL